MKIYIDENMPPTLAKGLQILEEPNNEGFEILSIKDEFGGGIEDEKWIPIVGNEGGVVITQDYNIQRTKIQNELYNKHGVGIFCIRPPGKRSYSYWDFVVYLINHWKDLKKIALKTKKPFFFICTPRKISK